VQSRRADSVSRLRLVAVGDVGRSTAYHVGDEAMLLGLIETARRGAIAVEWTVMSLDPARTAVDLGVRATPRLMFEDCAGPLERDARLAALDQLLDASPERWSDSAPEQWRDALAAIAECDGVVIAGGGNLSGSWPAEVFERTAVARAARSARRPVAITSQTIGPSFDERTQQLTAALLKDAAFIGLREARSHELAIELGAPRDHTVLQFDDATGVVPAEPSWWQDVAGDGPFIAVTLNQFGDPSAPESGVGAFARQLADISQRTGATIVLVPHVGDLHGPRAHDVEMAEAIAAAAGDAAPLRISPLPTPQHAVWIAARAELVVSTRYHPVVFASAATTPALFLHQDRYTFVKGCGAMSLVGLGSWTLPVAGAAAGLLVPATLELWTRRHEIRAHLRRVAPAIAMRRQRHVADLLSALVSPASSFVHESIPVFSGPLARDAWVAQAHDGTGLIDATVLALTAEVNRKQEDLVVAQTALADLTRSIQEAHAGWMVERASLERRASIAEEWAGVLAKEIERKEADLKIAIAALDEAARQRQ
jgi:polysaccharide pyruvyl transferase WcaK-like protein